jgi:hypothetical protein
MAAKAKQEEIEQQITSERIEIGLIDPHPMNYRRHPAEQIAGLRTSIRQFGGQVQSVVVQRQANGRYVFVAGHGLGEAARLEGLKELDCRVIPESWPHQKVMAYLVADNEHTRRSLDDDVQMASILQEVQDFDKQMVAAAGFTDAEFMALLGEVGEGNNQAKLKPLDVAKPPPNMVWALIGIPVVKFGAIAAVIDHLANNPDVILEMTTNNEERDS